MEVVAINPRRQWMAELKPDLLGGITVLHGDAHVSPPQDWMGQLYRRMDLSESNRIPVELIPYSA